MGEEIAAMSTRPFDRWLEMNRAALAPVVHWREITAEAAQKAVQHGLAIAQDGVELGTRQVQLLAEAKDPPEWMAEEGRIASEFGQKLMNRASNYVKAARETQEDLAKLAETTAKAAMDSFAAKSV